MKPTLRYFLIGLGIVLALLIIWYFLNLVAYVLISAVLALIGRPIVDFLGHIRIKKVKIPKAIRAFLALLTIWTVFVVFFRIFIPLIAGEVEKLSAIDPQKIMLTLDEPIKELEHIIDKYNISGAERFTVQDYLTQKAVAIFNISFLSSIFGSFANILGNIFIAIFSITFITFFFLRDEKLFTEGILTLVPDRYVEAFSHAMSSTRSLLMRYFLGIIGQCFGIFTLVTLGMTFIGVGFSNGILIGFLAALLNVIPYVGPLIGSSIGIVLGISTHLNLDFNTQLLPLIGLMILVFIIVQLIDNFIFQPFIFSNSVNAHPLEIFLVILIAGSLAGIAGMILAIPTYTVVRVFAKEFFNNFKVVKKLTKNIH